MAETTAVPAASEFKRTVAVPPLVDLDRVAVSTVSSLTTASGSSRVPRLVVNTTAKLWEIALPVESVILRNMVSGMQEVVMQEDLADELNKRLSLPE